MANLTDVIGTNMTGKETLQPYKKGPSIFEGINDLAGIANDTLAREQKLADERDAAARRAKADALANSDRGAQNFGAAALLELGGAENAQATDAAASQAATPLNQMDATLFGGATATEGADATRPYEAAPLTQGEIEQTSGAMAAGDQIGQRAATLQRGMKQGRISRAAYELQLEGILRKGFAMFPDSKYILLEQMNKYAVDHPIMTEYRQAKTAEEKDVGARQDTSINLRKHAVEKMGYDPALYSDEQLEAIGRTGIRSEYDLKLKNDEYDQLTKRAEFNRKESDRVNGARDEAMASWVYTTVGPQLSAGVELFNSFVQDQKIPEAERLKTAGEFINTYQPRAYALIDNTITRAEAEGRLRGSAAETVRKRLRAQVDDIFTQFSPSNPLNVLQANAKIVATLQSHMQLDALEVMPVFSSFKAAFGSSEAVQVMVESLAADPKLSSAFSREMKGFTGLQQGEQTIRIKNVMAFMSDNNTSLRDLTGPEAAQVIKDSNRLHQQGFYKLAMGGDEPTQRTVYNTLGKVANAAIDLNQGSSVKSLHSAMMYIADRGALGSIRAAKPEQREMAALVADESRAAVQKLIISMRGKQNADPYHKVVFNLPQRKFMIVPTGKAPNQGIVSSASGREGTYQTTNISTRGPTDETKATLQALNQGLSYLQATNEYEDDPIIKGASWEERARFYVAGMAPKSAAKKEGGESGRVIMSRLQNYWDTVKVDWSTVPKMDVQEVVEQRTGVNQPRIRVREDGSRVGTNLAGKSIVVPSAEEMAQTFGKNPIYQKVVETAGRLGIPVEVATRLAHVESKFKNTGKNSAGAQGPLQVTGKNWDKLSQEMFNGRKVYQLSADENVELGLTILKKNYDKRGNWQEAAHDYIGRGDDDGNIQSRVYAELIGA